MSFATKPFAIHGSWLLVSALFAASTVQAAINIAQAPLETGTAVDPNILFVLDDSGSMRWGFMPDELDTDFNLGNDCSSSTMDYAGAKALACSASGRKYLASSHLNTVYFDPAENYPVPLKPDGVNYYPTPSFTSAPHNGYDSSSSKVDLSSKYYALIADYYYPNRNGTYGFAISDSTSDRNPSPAFYFKYRTGCTQNERSDSCYDYVNVANLGAAEKQKFANWFSFYRTRMMLAKSGVSAAFQSQLQSMRVGYGAINSGVITADVAPFGGGNRSGFFSWLHGKQATGGTPLLTALDTAGQYYQGDKPWLTVPSDPRSAKLECRQSFTILMTDGYYDGSVSAGGNQDGSDGSTITGPNNPDYTYKASDPFRDGESNTLADVAMKYWKTDLRPDLANTVPVPLPNLNPAFWQHMVTFGVGLGVTGSVTAQQGFDAVTSKSAVNWWGGSEKQNKINDLLHASVNGRGGFFSANKPSTFASGLANTLANISARAGSASNIAATAINSLQTESNVYQARFIAGEWAGDLWSYKVDDVSTPVWKASEQLPAPAARNIWFGSSGSTGNAKAFVWSEMSAAEQKAFNNDAAVVDYIRGDRSKEKKNGGLYRDRTSLLGDLVNSSPELVSAPVDMSYHRYSWSGASSYRSFLESNVKSRPSVIYVGGNDGMLHGFNADTGRELLAFIPAAVMAPIGGQTVNVLKKYSEQNYQHMFSVDGSPTVVDVFDGNNWRSVLLGSQGRGGNALFALDVTDPARFGGNNVLWDKSFAELGVYLGEPQVFRLNSGHWALVAGYGYNNSSEQSGILLIDVLTGNIIKKLPTGKGSASDSNGMSEISTLDINNDGNIDWVYGGDLHGHVWKFDLSSASEAGWIIANNGQPLFSAVNAQNKRQSVTGGVLANIDPKTGKAWVFFGTGRYLNQDDPSNAEQQTMYGIIDGPTVSSRAELDARTITTVGDKRVVSYAAQLSVGKKGWYMDLVDTHERIVDMPSMLGGDLVLNTTIPDTNVCNPSGSGYIMAVSAYSGSRLKKIFFDSSGDKNFDNSDKVQISGTATDVSGIRVGSLNSVVTFAKNGSNVLALANCDGVNMCGTAVNASVARQMLSWHEISN